MKEKIVSFVFFILTSLNKVIIKKENQIVLYANLGFRDNVSAFYNYLIDNNYQEKYQIICVSNDFYSLEKNENVKYVSLVSGLYYFLTSKYFFYCFGKYPIKPSSKQIVVNLWHGMPLKKIGNLIPECSEIDYNFFTHLLVLSEFYVPTMKAVFNATDDQIMITGNPRCDDLASPINIAKTDKNIIWLPTYRDGQHDTLLFKLSSLEWEQINKQLKDADITLFIKLHPLEASLIDVSNFSNIYQITDAELSEKKISLYQFLGASDALITDYSSVFLDYLLINKPIGFVIDDIETYSGERGFVFDNVLDLMPGHHILDFSNLNKFINDITENHDVYLAERVETNNLVNKYKSNFSCQILEYLKIDK